MDLHAELRIAERAVRAAARVCRRVQGNLLAAGTLTKNDRSPVTVADFASQALVCVTLAEQSEVRAIVGEEDAAELRRAPADAVRAQVVDEVRAARGVALEVDEVLAWIDLGGTTPSSSSDAFWTLDPIDGTKGFLRGQHYAIALALIERGQVMLGALGCPHLDAPDGSRGLLLTAVRGGNGTRASALFAEAEGIGTAVRVGDVADPSQARFCESVDASHSDHQVSARIAARLGLVAEPLRLDSQAKYACVARGDASVYLRLPTSESYREKIWDHAAGLIVVEEAGGRVTDVRGMPLDFSRGRQLEVNAGVVASSGKIHAQVLDAVGAALGGGS
jgi:3'(2'), 5'-bisphosphate nucleotidase